jgi:hypothetical protein
MGRLARFLARASDPFKIRVMVTDRSLVMGRRPGRPESAIF